VIHCDDHVVDASDAANESVIENVSDRYVCVGRPRVYVRSIDDGVDEHDANVEMNDVSTMHVHVHDHSVCVLMMLMLIV
jgi:hypothetical protein